MHLNICLYLLLCNDFIVFTLIMCLKIRTVIVFRLIKLDKIMQFVIHVEHKNDHDDPTCNISFLKMV